MTLLDKVVKVAKDAERSKRASDAAKAKKQQSQDALDAKRGEADAVAAMPKISADILKAAKKREDSLYVPIYENWDEHPRSHYFEHYASKLVELLEAEGMQVKRDSDTQQSSGSDDYYGNAKRCSSWLRVKWPKGS